MAAVEKNEVSKGANEVGMGQNEEGRLREEVDPAAGVQTRSFLQLFAFVSLDLCQLQSCLEI